MATSTAEGQSGDYDTWAQLGNRGWGHADVLPYFKQAERRISPADERVRGRDGGLVVTDIDWSHQRCEAFIAGAVGLPRNPDYNGVRQDGVGYTRGSFTATVGFRPIVPSCMRTAARRTSISAPTRTPRRS